MQAQIEHVINALPPDKEKPDEKKNNLHESSPDVLISQNNTIEIVTNQHEMKQNDASNIVVDKNLGGGLENLLIEEKEGMDNIIVTHHHQTTEDGTEIGEIVVTAATATEIQSDDVAANKGILISSILVTSCFNMELTCTHFIVAVAEGGSYLIEKYTYKLSKLI